MTGQAVIGFAFLFAFAWAISEDRRAVSWRLVAVGIALQVLFALVLIKAPFAKHVFLALNAAVLVIQQATEAGTTFVFGYLGGGALPFEESRAGSSFVLGFRALPLILVVSALSALLFYWRILPRIVKGCAWVLSRSMGIGGALGVGAAANIFVGMVESPVIVRPYVARMHRGELFALMTTGMATIAGTVMVLYATVLGPVIPDALGQILSASVINVPAALVIAGLMVPAPGAATDAAAVGESDAESAMDAIAAGTAAGVKLVINVAAMLIVLVALVALFNQLLGLLPDVAGDPLSMQRILGWFSRAVGLAHRHPLGRGGHRRRTARQQARVERVDRLPRSGRPAPGRALATDAADPGLRDVRLCQSRQSRDSGRRPWHHRRGPAQRDRGAWRQITAGGISRDLYDRRDRRRARDLNSRAQFRKRSGARSLGSTAMSLGMPAPTARAAATRPSAGEVLMP